MNIDAPASYLGALHQLPYNLLHEESGGALRDGGTLSLSRAAFMCSNAWGTVSTSYRDEVASFPRSPPRMATQALILIRYSHFSHAFSHSQLLSRSTYASALRALGGGVACDSGLPLSKMRASLARHGDHAMAKTSLQQRCFGKAGVRSVPLLLFLGRVTYQKGVHLLLDCLPALLESVNGEAQVCVCGCADPSDAYARRCADQMKALQAAYPFHFWADPTHYFEEAELASAGADFGVIPSLFEPSGLVREEFYAAGTPLISSEAGGLRQRIAAYDKATGLGEGVIFSGHSHTSLLNALTNAIKLYKQPEHYRNLRNNAYRKACDISTTAAHWRCEIERLFACHRCESEFLQCDTIGSSDSSAQ